MDTMYRSRARDFRAIARDILSGRWMPVVGTTFLASLLGASVLFYEGNPVMSYLFSNSNGDTTYQIENAPWFNSDYMVPLLIFFASIASVLAIVGLVQFIIGPFISLGLIQYNLDMLDRKDPDLGVVFSRSSMLGKALWLKIRGSIFIILWALLFVIPGIIKSYSYSMAGYILEENPEVSAKEAMTVSMDMMRGNKFRLFCLQFSFIGWGILCGLTLGIGFLWLSPYMNAAYTAFYNEVSQQYQKMTDGSAYHTDGSYSHDLYSESEKDH